MKSLITSGTGPAALNASSHLDKNCKLNINLGGCRYGKSRQFEANHQKVYCIK